MFILLTVLSAAGLGRLFMLRLATGESFPPYSSLRSDPLGCRALYNSFEITEGMKVTRNFRPLSRLEGSDRTLFIAGAGLSLLSNIKHTAGADIEKFARAGNRVVIAFRDDLLPDCKPCGADKDKKPIAGIWEVLPAHLENQGTPGSTLQATLSATDLDLQPELAVHSRVFFQSSTPEWRVIYSAGDKPVLMERKFGKGSIVILAEPYILSNEAMFTYRQTSILTWLAGKNHEIVFDEFHLGVAEQGGIMVLVRRFGLIPFILVLLSLGILYLWNSAVPLVAMLPPEGSPQSPLSQQDSFSGLVNLLRRSIPSKDLIKVCVFEWKKSARKELESDRAFEQLVQEISAGSGGAAERYRKIARLKGERKKR